MKRFFSILTVFACTAFLVLITSSLFAQTGGETTATSNKTPVVTKRQKNQQKRIAKGVKSGELTAKETKHLEKEEAKIQHDKAVAKSDGTVTKQERAKLQREENKASRDIYKKKHNKKKQ